MAPTKNTGVDGDLTPFIISDELLSKNCRTELAAALHFMRYEAGEDLLTCAEKLMVCPQQIEQLENGFTASLDLNLALRFARLYGHKLVIYPGNGNDK